MKNKIAKAEPTINSREVAEMIGKEHNKLLRDIKTYIAYLGEANFGHSDFFKESTYISEQNKELPCYEVTKKGCEFIANKLTGKKGTLFTASYINRFHEMEDYIKEEQPQKKANLSSVNMMAKILKDTYKEAGVDPKFTAVAINNLYKEQTGITLPLPIKAEEEKLYDCTEIAKELSIYSKTGNPHNKAVSAIIQKLDIDKSLIVKTPFMRNGHSDFTFQYKPLVLEKVKLWVRENNYPEIIIFKDRNGTESACKVKYGA